MVIIILILCLILSIICNISFYTSYNLSEFELKNIKKLYEDERNINRKILGSICVKSDSKCEYLNNNIYYDDIYYNSTFDSVKLIKRTNKW